MKEGSWLRLSSAHMPIRRFSEGELKKARNERQYAKRIPRKTIEVMNRKVTDLGDKARDDLIRALEASLTETPKKIRVI